LSQFTVTIKAAGLIDASTEKNLTQSANYVANLLDRYIAWNGVLDIEVQVKPASALTWATANGLLPSLGQITWNGKGWTNSTLNECLTGVDTNTQLPDAGCTIYLGSDGTVRNYGTPVWFDPNPKFDVKPDLPKGHFDFIGVLTHEIFHCLGFYGATDQWKKFVAQDGAQSYFNGPITQALLGSPLPISPGDNNDHYGNTSLVGNNVPRGLMFQFGNYELNRLDIGRIDLAVLQDLGYQIKTYDGLPLFELADSAPNVTGTNASETLYGNYQDNNLSGLGGNDTLDGGLGIDTAKYANAKSNYNFKFLSATNKSLIDNSGSLVADTLISIERLKFSDANLAIDIEGNAGTTVKIIGAVFGPSSVANKSFVGIGLSYLDGGMSYANLMQLAIDASFGRPGSNSDVVKLLYTNVVGSAPDATTLAFYKSLLDNGTYTQATLGILAAETFENTTNINLIGLAKTGVEYV